MAKEPHFFPFTPPPNERTLCLVRHSSAAVWSTFFLAPFFFLSRAVLNRKMLPGVAGVARVAGLLLPMLRSTRPADLNPGGRRAVSETTPDVVPPAAASLGRLLFQYHRDSVIRAFDGGRTGKSEGVPLAWTRLLTGDRWYKMGGSGLEESDRRTSQHYPCL